jgi:hypothetical protein
MKIPPTTERLFVLQEGLSSVKLVQCKVVPVLSQVPRHGDASGSSFSVHRYRTARIFHSSSMSELLIIIKFLKGNYHKKRFLDISVDLETTLYNRGLIPGRGKIYLFFYTTLTSALSFLSGLFPAE